MKTLTKFQQLDNLLTDIAGVNENLSACEDQAIKRGHTKYLQLEYAACYGGYRVVMVNITNGGHSGAFGLSSACERISFNEMQHFLSGILIGMELTLQTA